MFKLNILLFLVLYLLTFCLIIVVAKRELVFVNVLYRHGDRTPVQMYPNDPYKNESLWPCPFGELTNTGKRQLYDLGIWLRKRYDHFLPAKYAINDIYVRATDVDRVLMSAGANLAGLYPTWRNDNENLLNTNWQPIPVHTQPKTNDPVLYSKKCRKYDEKMAELLSSEHFQIINQTLQPLYKYISYHSGKEVNDLRSLLYFYDTLYIEELYGFKLPKWTRQIYPHELKKWASIYYTIPGFNLDLQRLEIGLYLNEVFGRFLEKIQGKLQPDRKMWLYSAHDITIADVLMAFDAFEPEIPPYASSIIMELIKEGDGNYYVSTYYKTNENLRAISIKGCNKLCPIYKVLKVLKPILITPEQWKIECNTK